LYNIRTHVYIYVCIHFSGHTDN